MGNGKIIENKDNCFVWEAYTNHNCKYLDKNGKNWNLKTLYKEKQLFEISLISQPGKSEQIKIQGNNIDGARFINIKIDKSKEDLYFSFDFNKENEIRTSFNGERVLRELRCCGEEESSMQIYLWGVINHACGIGPTKDLTLYEMMHKNRHFAKTLAPNGYFTPHKEDLLNTKHIDPDTSVVLWYMQKYPDRHDLDGEYPFGLHKITFQDVVDAAKEKFDSVHSGHNQINYEVSCLIARLDRALDAEGISNPVFEAIHNTREVNVEDIDIKPIWRNFQDKLDKNFISQTKKSLVNAGVNKRVADLIINDIYKNPKRDAVDENKKAGADKSPKVIDKKK